MTPFFLSRIPLKVYAFAGIAVFAMALFVAYSYQKDRADKAVDRAATATVQADALNTVATKTEDARSEQKEKQADVDKIEGSDTRLPDGWGVELQRVRDRKAANPR